MTMLSLCTARNCSVESRTARAHRNWNERFQALLEQPVFTPEEVMEREKAIDEIAQSFAEV